MTKAHDSLAPEPGKVGGADTDKVAGGTLDKEYVDDTGADYGTYAENYEPGGGYDGGGGYSGGGGSSDDGADDTTDDSTEDTAAEPEADTPEDPLYVEGGGDGDDIPVTDDFDTDHPTKPGLPEDRPEEPRPPTTPPGTVSIDIEAMTRLVAAMERAGEQIVALQDEMRTILSGVRLDTSDTTRFDQVAEWIREELPGLRRRLAMAQDLMGGGGASTQPDQHRPVPRPYVGDESQVSTRPPRESYDAGHDTAQRFGVPGDNDTTRQLVAELRANRRDPYYAREFAHTADPETLVRAIVQAGGTEQAAELAELTAATVATAARGTGELAPPAGYEEQWAALRESDDPAVAGAAEQLRPA